MTLEEILTQNGVGAEVAKKILADMKTSKIYTASEENLDVRYGKLKTQHETTTASLAEAQTLIETLKKSTKGNEELQGKITQYETQVAALQEALKKTQIESAIKVGLLEGKALDADAVDYLTFQLTKGGEELTVGEDGRIKGWSDKLAGLKTRFPTQFEAAASKKYEEHKLESGEPTPTAITKEQFNQMGYAARVELRKNDPGTYDRFTKG